MRKFISILLLFSAIRANAQCVKYFRKVDFDQPEIKGIKPIDDRIVSHVNQYYKFTYNKNGQLVRVDPDHHFNHQSRFKFILINRKESVQTRIYYWNGQKPNVYAIDSSKIIFNQDKTSAEYILYQGKNYSDINPHLYWTLNDKGLITKIIDRRPGVHRLRIILNYYDEKYRLLKKEEVYPSESVTTNNNDTTFYSYKYDDKDNLIECRVKLWFEEKESVYRYKYDEKNYLSENYSSSSENHDPYGNLIYQQSSQSDECDGGYSSTKHWNYDNRGNLIMYNENYRGARDVSPRINSTSYKYDENNGTKVVKVKSYCNNTLITSTEIRYDKNENIVEEESYKKDTLIYKIERKYDSDQNLIEHINYDRSKNPTYKIRLDYLNNKIYRISIYDDNNRLIPLNKIQPSKNNIKSGIAVIEFQYNKKQDKTILTYYDDKMNKIENKNENTLTIFYYYFSPMLVM